MVSKISIVEFKERLVKNTKFGNPKIKGTPFAVFSIFGESNKFFFGTYNDTNFKLTKNSTLFVAPFIISGKFNSTSNNQTKIDYEVEPIGLGYYWIKYLPLFGIFVFNLIFYIESTPVEMYVILNLILLVFFIFSHFFMRQKKNKLIAIFEKVFEIRT